MIIIIRYNNRKLYNTSTHRYVTLQEFYQIYVDNSQDEVKVLEYGTDVDLTQYCYFAALAAQSRKGLNAIAK